VLLCRPVTLGLMVGAVLWVSGWQQEVRGSNPLSSTRHFAPTTPHPRCRLPAICQQMTPRGGPNAVSVAGSLLVEGHFGRRQDHRQAFFDRGHEAGGHLRGGVPVVGTDGAALVPPGPAAGLVAHHLVDDPAGRPASSSQVEKVCRKSWAPWRSRSSGCCSGAASRLIPAPMPPVLVRTDPCWHQLAMP
jgi:hypothetical protein